MNLRHGLKRHGRFIWAAPLRAGSAGGGEKIKYLPDCAQVVCYNRDGAKSAVFGDNTWRQSFYSLAFELTGTGCGEATLKFKRLPPPAELNHGQRLDIHLYGDYRPWWSGYVLTRPDAGGTGEEFAFKCHGFYNALKYKLIFQRYQGWEVADIAADIAARAESLGVVLNGSKIYPTGYRISDIEFDGVTAQECLKQLSEFAAGWVYGVDEWREFYFKPRVEGINEEARFWAGEHLKAYLPEANVDKIVNWARVKGAQVDEAGEQWLATVEDTASQALYGRREEKWDLPTAYAAQDARRWGEEEIKRYKDPIRSAKVKGVSLNYPRPGGVFWVRKLSTDGQAAITNLNGEMTAYPISKLKYTVDAAKGIALDMELGEQPKDMAEWVIAQERAARDRELLQQAATKQIKAG
jgi:hypothetical protein